MESVHLSMKSMESAHLSIVNMDPTSSPLIMVTFHCSMCSLGAHTSSST